MDSLLLILGLVALILLGAPIALAMILLPTIYILITGAAPLVTIPHQMYAAVSNFPLIAIPFFMLTGELMNSSSITARILDLSRSLVGRTRGGLAQVNVVASIFFAGMNGSAVADTATIGTILIPAMKRSGYSGAFAAAVTAIGSTIGGIIPPSIALIVLASAANLSVGALFLAGILPGLLVGAMLMAVTYVIAKRRDYERGENNFSLARAVRAFGNAAFALLVPVALVAGIIGGVFSSVEAGAITAGVAFAVGTLIYRGMTLSGLTNAFGRALRLSASVFIIIAAAGPLSWLLTRIGTLQLLQDWLVNLSGSPVLFVLALIGLILIAGMFMDATANVIVLGPMLVSASTLAGYDPVQAALVVAVGFLLGTVTPPVGVCYFTAAIIADAPLDKTAIELMPYMAVEVLVLFILLFVPPLTLLLPTFFGFM
jgi:tripartite ATP-independent transporter DctM subunit